MKERGEEDPLDRLLDKMGAKGTAADTLQLLTDQLGEFYSGLALLLKHGSPWQKKRGLQLFTEFQEKMRGRLQLFCEREGIDIKEMDRLLHHPQLQASSKIQAAKKRVAELEEKLYSSLQSKSRKEKPLAKGARKRKMEKQIQAKQ